MPNIDPAESRQSPSAPYGTILSAIDSAPINILIVDDEPKNLTVLESLLDAPGYRLVRAESADQALLALVAEEFALLILDIRMPGMTGFELAQIIKGRKKTAQIPIIFLTAYYNEDQHVLEGYGSGAVDYLHKPVNPAVLRSKVAVFAELHRKGREVVITNRTLLAEVTERRRVEEQLRELNDQLDRRVAKRTAELQSSDTRLRLATDAVELAIWAWHTVDDTWVWENAWATTIYGVTLSECPKSSEALGALVDEQDLQAFRNALAQTREFKAPFHFEGRIRRLDGSTHWIELDGSCVGADGARVLGTVRDVTERRRAQIALRESEARYRALFQSIDEGLCVLQLVFDDAGRPADFVFASCNPAFEKHSGLVDIVGQLMSKVVPDLEPEWLQMLADAAGSGEGFRRQAEIRSLSRFADVYAFSLGDASKDRIAILFRDITERFKSEEALRERERFLSTVTGAARIGLAIIELDGTYRFANESIAQMVGRPVSAILGRPVSSVMSQAWPVMDPHLRNAFKGERASFEYSEIDPSTATTRHFGAFLEPHSDRDDARTVAVVMVEITDLKRLESELKETDRRKDEFLATLAHELRNPLAPVRNAVTILNLSAAQTKEGTWAISLIDRQLGVMVRLIDDLMDVTRINQGRIDLHREPLLLSSVLALAVESSRPQLEEYGHQLSIYQPNEDVLVDADLTRLSQVFMNLITNAAKYTDRGGQIDIQVESHDREVRVTVRDNGIGIDQSNLGGVFNMFSQIESALGRSRGGLGIGLSLVKRLVEMHGGNVEAMSAGLGMGSSFKVTLPVFETEAAMSLSGPETFLSKGATGTRRILIVDDNEDAADSLSRLLTMTGHTVRVAYDGLSGLELAEEFRPDVLLLDIGMPKLNGYETCRRLRTHEWGRKIFVIATTGWGDVSAKSAVIEAGFDHHFIKPLDEKLLNATLSSLPAELP